LDCHAEGAPKQLPVHWFQRVRFYTNFQDANCELISCSHALTVQQHMIDHYFPTIASVTWNNQPVEAPRPLKWYPEELAWSMTTPKQVVRRFPPFASFQKFLVSETTIGNISRQEVVSMIPPLFMDIKPGMMVMDLCAAPGSKTAQLLEMLHGGEEARVRRVVREIAKQNGRDASPDGTEIEAESSQIDEEDEWSDDGRSTGLLIANDVDWKRAQLLIHQTKRLNSPNLIVTNHDARHYPSIALEHGPGHKNKYMKFDRILADVPCTGDGTARKNINVWKDWKWSNGLNLHGLQGLILVRALQMLKVGGRVVYSTCSLNPIENEAVISSVIDRCGGPKAVRILDCSTQLPDLKRVPGLTKWKVMDKAGREWQSWKEMVEAMKGQGEENFGKIVEGMFPIEAEDDNENIPLERCMRVYPHLQDTGGFFITVLEKLTEIKRLRDPPSQRKEPSSADGAAADIVVAPTNGKLQTHQNGVDEDSNMYVNASEAVQLNNLNGASNLALNPDGAVADPLSSTKDATSTNDTPIQIGVPMDISNPESPKRRLDELDEPVDSKRQRIEQHASEPSKQTNANVRQTESKKPGQAHEEPFKYLDPNHEELTRIHEFYDLSPRFPRDRFMVRNASGHPAKAIYYTSAMARQILTLNEGTGIKFVHCGVKMFVKQDTQSEEVCRWRIQAEGLPIVEPWVGEKRIIRLYKRPTLHKLLREMFPQVSGDGWKELGEIGEKALDISMGCCVLRVEASGDEDGFKERMIFPLWRSLSSLNLMIPKEDRK
jgi:multisite-specific tRNA:(cytosine-C5)-methyltransferase